MAMFTNFADLNLDVGRLNYGSITQIPKVKEANKIQQYRPISLLNVIYKFSQKL